jgi:hypothetical protein
LFFGGYVISATAGRQDVNPDCVGNDTPGAGSLPDGSYGSESRSRRWGIVAFFFPDVTVVPLLFAVDATAVRLPVHPDLLRNPDPFGPAFAEIPIEEGNPLRSGHTLGDLPDQIVFLIAAIEEGGRKGIEPALFRKSCGVGKPEMIAVPATFFLPKGNLSEKCLKEIDLIPDDCEPLLTGVGRQRIEAFSILQIRMDVGVVKETADLVSFTAEDPHRVDGARGATDMQ